jgi:hypothetical protein
MTIIYIVITRNKKSILCEYTEYNGNLQQISLHLLNKLHEENVDMPDDRKFVEKIETNKINIVSNFSVIYDFYKFYVINRIIKKENIIKNDIHHPKKMIERNENKIKSNICEKENGDFKIDSFQSPLLDNQSEIINSCNYLDYLDNSDSSLISFVCLVHKENDDEKLIFNFLENLISKFFHFYSEDGIDIANSFSLKEFVNILKKEMNKFNLKNVKNAKNKISTNENKKEILFKKEVAGKKYFDYFIKLFIKFFIKFLKIN